MRQDVYKGNSVQHWHSKAKAYGDAITAIHDLLPWGAVSVVDKVKSIIEERDELKRRVEELEAFADDLLNFRECSVFIRGCRYSGAVTDCGKTYKYRKACYEN